MVRLSIVIGIAVSAIACRDPDLEELRAIKRDVCGCKARCTKDTPGAGGDAINRCAVACAEAGVAKIPQHGNSGPRQQKIAAEILACLAQVYEDERPVTDPDAATK